MAAATTSTKTADSGVVTIPKTPAEIAAEGTALGKAGSEATGQALTVATADAGADTPVSPYRRVWGMDADHTTDNRNKPDQLHPDCSVLVAGSGE